MLQLDMQVAFKHALHGALKYCGRVVHAMCMNSVLASAA
jgi:hypothetical protein